MIAIHATAFAAMRQFLSRRSVRSGCCRSKRRSAYSLIIGAFLEDNSKADGSLAAVPSTSRSLAIIGELAAEGIGVIVISSDLPEVLALSDRVLIMREGRQMAILDRADADPESVMNAAMGQASADPIRGRPE